MHQWIAAHDAIVPNATQPGTDRKVPGQQYESFPNCQDDAFLTAAKTLTARAEAYGKTSPEVLDWLRGQDAVFSNCSDGGAMPQPAPANAPLWLRQDRAYQIAAADFYSLKYEEAIAGFRAIAADSASPWHTLAPYLVARALIREATVSSDRPQPTTVPDEFTAALQQLDAILKDPALKSIHPAANDLRDLVAARVEPEAQAQTLAQRLTLTPHGLDFSHNLVDLTYILNNQSADKWKVAKDNSAGLLSFMRTISTPTAPPPPSYYESTPPETTAQTSTRLAHQHAAAKAAYAEWQSSKKSAWLVAAMTLAQPDDPFATDLIATARTLPPDSPAYATATYNRLRLEAAAPATRTELTTLLPALERSESRSTINLFGTLLTQSAPTLAEFLKAAPRLPAGTDFDGMISSSLDIPTPQLCGPKVAPAKTPLFDSYAATILNQRLPLRLLRDAALNEALAPNLRFQIANAAVTRAVLLNDPATVAALTPTLTACQEALKPWLDRYNAATSPEQRHLRGLFLLMHFPSTEPLVRTGNQRSNGFASYSELRDNWWAGNTQYVQPEARDDRSYSYYSGVHTVTPESPNFKPSLFSVRIVPTPELPSPPFLTGTDTTDANREILALQHIPGAADYFARQALTWVKAHPESPDNPDLLGFATRTLRNSPRSADTRELNHQLFLTLHRKYPNSTWAKRYTTWE